VNLGYCGLDRDRRPLRGDEIRPCWEGVPGPVAADAGAAAPIPLAPRGPLGGFFAEPENR